MKYTFLTLIAILLTVQLYAQKIELSVQANSGLYHYGGKGATSTTAINDAGIAAAYFNNPYGNKNGVAYGAGIQAQHVAKGGFIVGLQGGYEFLKSEADITEVHYPPVPQGFYGPFAAYQSPATGHAYLQNQNINLNPYIGYRLSVKAVKIDLMPGVDFGFNLNSYQKGSATVTNSTLNQGNVSTGNGSTTYLVDQKLKAAPTDIRLRFGAAAWYKRFGLTLSYAHGLKNFASGLVYVDNNPEPAPEVHSELFRFGIAYRIL